MANCKECGAKIGFLSAGEDCDRCYEKNLAARDQARDQERLEAIAKAKEKKLKSEKKKAQVEAIMLTTETAPNLKITKRIEIVTAECAFGMNIFKDLFAGVRDIVGGRSEAVQKTMRDSRKTALYELKVEASLVGANAVVGVDLDYVELGSSGGMVMLVASGTAVIIED